MLKDLQKQILKMLWRKLKNKKTLNSPCEKPKSNNYLKENLEKSGFKKKPSKKVLRTKI